MSNIFVGISTWAVSTAYAVGARRRNGGNAYHCITAGTSAGSGGPTGTGSNITDGTAHWKYLAGVDFTTAQAWFDAIPTTLSSPALGELWDCGDIIVSAGTLWLNATGKTTSPTNNITLRCATGEGIRDIVAAGGTLAYHNTTGVRVVLPASDTPNEDYLYIDVSNMIVDGIQFICANPSPPRVILGTNFGALTGIVIKNCVFDAFAQSDAPTVNILAAATVVYNCLLVDRQLSTDANPSMVLRFANTCVVHNCMFFSVNGNINGTAIEIIDCQGGGSESLINCSILNYAHPTETDFSNQFDISYCLTSSADWDGTGNSSIIDSGNNKYSASPSGEVINVANDFRLKAGAQSINAGTTDSATNAAADDIARKSRPQGIAWDIGPFEAGVAQSVIVGRATPGVVSAIRQTATIKRLAQTNIALSIQVIAASTNKAVSAAQAQARSVSRSRGLVLGAFGSRRPWSPIFSLLFGPPDQAMTASILMSFPRVVVLGAQTFVSQVAAGSGSPWDSRFSTLFGPFTAPPSGRMLKVTVNKLIGLTSPEAMFVGPFLRRLSFAITQPQAARVTRSLLLIQSVLSSAAVRLVKTAGLLKARTQTQAFSVLFLTLRANTAYGASTSSTVSVSRLTARFRSLSAVSASLASMDRIAALSRSITAGTLQVVTIVPVKSRQILANVIQTSVLQIRTSHGRLLPVSQTRLASLLRSANHPLAVAQAQVVSLLRASGIIRSATQAMAVTFQSQPGKTLLITRVQAVALIKLVGYALRAAQTQVANAQAYNAILKAVATSSPETTSLSRVTNKLVNALSPLSGAVRVAIGTSLSLLQALVAAALVRDRVRSVALTASHTMSAAVINGSARLLGAAQTQIDSLTTTTTRQIASVLGVTQDQIGNLIRFYGKGLGTESVNVVGLVRLVSITLQAITINHPTIGKLRRLFISAATDNTAGLTASRAMLLGVGQTIAARIVTWFHFFVPDYAQTRVLLPPYGGPAEPPSFSAFDPEDQEVFTFDWSSRADPGDLIQSVSVSSVPAGLNLVGPVFVDRYLVDVTVGPSPQVELPVNYGLRCTVRFVSGRRSSFTVAVPVRTL